MLVSKTPRTIPRFSLLSILATLLATFLLSCVGPLTEVWVIVESNIPVSLPASTPGLQSIQVTARITGEMMFFADQPFSLTQGMFALPGHFVIRPTTADETRPVELVIEGLLQNATKVSQRAVFTFARGRRLVLRMFLASECVGQREIECRMMNRTCGAGGMCIEPERMNLPEYYPDAPAPTMDATMDVVPPADVMIDPSLTAPQLISPLSGSVMSTRTPTIRWDQLPTAGGSVLEFFSDRACTQPVGSPVVHASPGDRQSGVFAFGAGSAIRVVYFRAYNTAPGRRGPASPVWQMRLPRVSAPGAIDSAIRTDPDYNGDGYADIAYDITGPMGTKELRVEFGKPTGGAGPAVARSIANVNFTSPRLIGDVNGDGFVDFAVGNTGRRSPLIYTGRTDTQSIFMAASPTVAILGSALNDYGALITAADDVNGDGYKDFMIGAGFPGRMTPQTYLQLGGPDPMLPAAILVSTGASSALGGFGISAADMDGDGRSEIAISQPFIDNPMTPNGRNGLIDIFRWSSMMGPPSMAARLLMNPEQPNQQLGLVLSLLGDNNGDGRADLITNANGYFAALGTAGAIGWKAGATGMLTPSVNLLRAGTPAEPLGRNIAQVGDLNGDGYGEIATTVGPDAPTSMVHIYAGSAMGPVMSPPAMSLSGNAAMMSSVGSILAGVGDFNGDGFDDFVCPLVATPAPMSRLDLYLGGGTYPLTSTTIATGTIHGVAGTN